MSSSKFRPNKKKGGAFKKLGKKYRTPNMTTEKRFFKDKGARYLKTKLLCRECRAVYDGKSWHAFEKLDPRMIDELKISICPACHEKIDHLSDGILHLSGTGLAINKEEIKHLIVNTAAREEERDILNRVERIEENQNGDMVVYTTKNQLAVEIGKKIANAHKGGKLEIQWSRDDKPVEVRWHFDLKTK